MPHTAPPQGLHPRQGASGDLCATFNSPHGNLGVVNSNSCAKRSIQRKLSSERIASAQYIYKCPQYEHGELGFDQDAESESKVIPTAGYVWCYPCAVRCSKVSAAFVQMYSD